MVGNGSLFLNIHTMKFAEKKNCFYREANVCKAFQKVKKASNRIV
jgi:hypothetical protein